MKLQCILARSHSRGTLKKKEARGKTRLSTSRASREELKTGFPRAYVVTETPICGWYLRPLRRRQLSAIASLDLQGFSHLRCMRVRAIPRVCADNSVAAAIRAAGKSRW